MTKIPTLRQEHSNPTQRLMVWRHLKQAPLTQLEALQRYGIMRLGARIYELREAGFPILRRIVKHGKARVAEYFLESKAPA